MHVVQALVSLDIGGSELVAVETTEHLCASGHQVTVLAATGPLAGRTSSAGASLLEWPVGRKRLSTLRYVKQLRTWLLQNQPDIIHAHSRMPAWVCYLALRKLPANQRPVLITSVHGQYSVNRYSAIMARGDQVVTVSNHIHDYTLKNYLPADSQKLHTIYGGINHADFPFGHQPDEAWWRKTLEEFPQLANKRLLLLPGRLSRYKGHAVFIGLLARLQAEYPDLHGIILGRARPGSRYIKELEKLTTRNNLADKLTFTGTRTDIRDWMAASSQVFNLCSDPPEAFGRTVPEALSLGVPVIAWNHGGVAEILHELFPEGAVTPNDQLALAQKARTFLQDKPAVRQNDAFSLQTSMDQTMGLYRAVLTPARGG